MSEKPNCYQCKHMGSVIGSAHSSCHHPATQGAHTDPLMGLLAIFASVGRTEPQIAFKAAEELGISAVPHGVRNGWFNWPWNFDPVWLTSCTGFESNE